MFRSGSVKDDCGGAASPKDRKVLRWAYCLPRQPNSETTSTLPLRKEVIQPHLPIRLPCYDLTPVTGPAFGSSSLAVRSLTSGITNSHGLTGGVYKTRERIHRNMLICDY